MTLRLNGSTSGYVELDAPAVAGASALTLPAVTGTLLTAEGGKVLQVVRATDTTNRTTTSTTFVDVTGMSVTITPQKSTSSVILLAVFSAYIQNTGSQGSAIYQIADSSDNGISGAQTVTFGDPVNAQYFQSTLTLVAYATPATLSAVTYKLRFKKDGGAVAQCQNGSQSTGQMYAIEVSA